ncbi:MAG TPA: oxygen-independent coproporphyrinogen III oxidase [Thermoanaerobaculia bacterium]|nr:oxygen-independent coproporphyrinogen III oxidase [Thermoanaerobaculia bacterium]
MSAATQTIPFDRELVKKYDRPGPRYTSYPTAPWFREGFGSADYSELLLRSSAPEGGAPALPLSVYVHVPFCETRCFFCGCNVVVSRSKDRARDYLPWVEREMAAVAELAEAAERRTVQVHWGGGTPTFLPPEETTALMAAVRRYFPPAPGCEIGVEVDPRRLTEAHLDALAAAGVNRLSMGVQDLDAAVQRAVNRVQPAEETWSVLAGARERGMTSVNIDLIYGLPHQTPASFAATVAEVVRMAPDRIALFNFAYLPEMFPHQRAIDGAALPGPEDKLTILEETIAALTGAGYAFIGMDHFAKPEDPLAKALADRTLTRNFQGYSTCGETDLVAFGVSSISHVAGGFAQNGKEVPDYTAALGAGRLPVFRGLVSTPEDRLRRDVILGLMGHFHLDKDEVEAAHGIDFDRHFAAELEALAPLAADGLVEAAGRALRVTPLGRLLVRNVAMVFDEYLGRRSEVRYSRTV